MHGSFDIETPSFFINMPCSITYYQPHGIPLFFDYSRYILDELLSNGTQHLRHKTYNMWEHCRDYRLTTQGNHPDDIEPGVYLIKNNQPERIINDYTGNLSHLISCLCSTLPIFDFLDIHMISCRSQVFIKAGTDMEEEDTDEFYWQ